MVVAIAASGVVSACGSTGGSEDGPIPTLVTAAPMTESTPTTIAEPSADAGMTVWETEDLDGIAGVRYPQVAVDALATSEESVWIVPPAKREIYRLDPASDTVVAMSTGPVGAPVDIEVAGGWVWVVGGNEWLHRVDPDEVSIVETIEDVFEGFSLTGTEESLWILTESGNSLTQVDLTTFDIADPIAFDGVGYFYEPNMAADDELLWLTDLRTESGPSVLRVDPATGRTDTILTEPDSTTPAAVAAVHGAVFALVEGELIQLDPVTGERVWAVPAAVPSPWDDRSVGVVGIAATDDGIWFGDADGNISLVDPTSGAVVRTVEVGIPTSLRLLGATQRSLWLVDDGLGDGSPERVLTRIDLP
jgi:streptogramin lyase